LHPKAYALVEMSLEEIFHNLSKFESNPRAIWKALCTSYPKQIFSTTIAEEFENIFNDKDQKIIQREINKVKHEAEKSVKEIEEQSKDELK
jgi:hypothetical protein